MVSARAFVMHYMRTENGTVLGIQG
ncbi:unnamed protein product [Kuraishia capsulata CBS 1993]|uniref:Uncharacterized protein n=1 Tax=Kuraishia capsulata CBS 1993 TaxID=1382522 RepID=W6MW19_9ASCO|nr:unnamed protein product [Kuraishia capsulata CBS 1993]